MIRNHHGTVQLNCVTSLSSVVLILLNAGILVKLFVAQNVSS
jgi:hypothetical protein